MTFQFASLVSGSQANKQRLKTQPWDRDIPVAEHSWFACVDASGVLSADGAGAGAGALVGVISVATAWAMRVQ